MGPANSLRISRVLRYSGAGLMLGICRVRGCHPLWPIVPNRSTIYVGCLYGRSYYPDAAETASVWAAPRSLATTCGIIVIFFSYG